MKKLGLIAGNRNFPLLLSEQAKKDDFEVVAIAFKKNTSSNINRYASKVFWLDIREFNRIFEIFKKEGIEEVVMAGQINPSYLFNKKIMDNQFIKDFLKDLCDRRASTIFNFIAQRLNNEGFKVLDSTIFMKDFIPSKGVLTLRHPDFNTWQQVYFGMELAKKIALLDIGQTIAVKNKTVVAVEAMEGTDRLILRAGKIAGRGITLVKVSSPSQDMRFDLPVVGINTVKNLIKIKAECLAIEAEKTIFLNRDKAVQLANKKNFCIVAL
ncbi:MAG: UDP-2,3-diacylglucosamine diphosphatase LpxI [Candidatus Omnitrophica bacterium]|nr:UDP-2,3-diacylglucosamine diphosphatase LpxI [Candidatus Omnitrophota bacterium]MCM8799776.1 UDP-2,3-diacylglucosamine diphosphatase LpxI [Candidatus Omnitrophota bacterium]